MTVKSEERAKEGGPYIPPPLFFIIMEYLHRSLKNLKLIPYFNFHPRCEKLQIANIHFVDDLMLFTRGDALPVLITMEEFMKVSYATCLKSHPSKCKLYFGGVQARDRQDIGQP